jgi:hypothetical protein
MQNSRAIEAPCRSTFMDTAIIVATMALLSLATLALPQVGFVVKLMVTGLLLGPAILSGAVYAVHAVLLAALLLIPGTAIPLFRVWPFTILGPLAIYGALAVAVPRLRHSMGWIRRGMIDPQVTVLIIATVPVSSLSLVGWVVWLKPDIQPYLASMPKLPFWAYPLNIGEDPGDGRQNDLIWFSEPVRRKKGSA